MKILGFTLNLFWSLIRTSVCVRVEGRGGSVMCVCKGYVGGGGGGGGRGDGGSKVQMIFHHITNSRLIFDSLSGRQC